MCILKEKYIFKTNSYVIRDEKTNAFLTGKQSSIFTGAHLKIIVATEQNQGIHWFTTKGTTRF